MDSEPDSRVMHTDLTQTRTLTRLLADSETLLGWLNQRLNTALGQWETLRSDSAILPVSAPRWHLREHAAWVRLSPAAGWLGARWIGALGIPRAF